MTIRQAVTTHFEAVVADMTDAELGRWIYDHSSRGDFEFLTDRGPHNLEILLGHAMCKDYEDGTPKWLMDEAFKHYLDVMDNIIQSEMDARDFDREWEEEYTRMRGPI